MGDGNGVTDLLVAGLRASRLQGQAIANNIANLNTPGYRRVAVDFKDFLARAMKASQGKADLPEAVLHQPKNTEVQANGNDVDLDVEVGELIKNSGTYKTYMRILAKQYQQMELAMQDK